MIALLLHHHQPDYRDPVTREPRLPWVRRHAVRGYRDVARALQRTGGRATINLVPSLLDQLDHYAAGGSDPWLRLVERPAADLRPDEQAWMTEHLFLGHPDRLAWFPAFARLRTRTGVQAMRDLQVWTELAWLGWSALEDHPALAELRAKGEGFDEGDKAVLLAALRRMYADLRALHRDLPEVSASPYYHPILPLLVDTAHAQRCLPGVPDPGFRHPEDARLQLVRGKERVAAWAGADVRGLWPSEGSVSPEVLELAAAAGFRWVATDQGVLERSERADAGDHHGPWVAGALRLVFRDRALSDRIGFDYARRPDALQDLLQAARQDVLLALDGENPWEAWPDAGREFLLGLLGSGRTETAGAFADLPPRGTVRRVHTGSWIRADFAIWIGHAEDREAWSLLARCRADWEAAGRPAGAEEHLLAAEGSDWFWWYGEDFTTELASAFDDLFRGRLLAAWRAMGRTPPEEAYRPIKRRIDDLRVESPFPGPPGDDWYTFRRQVTWRPKRGTMAGDDGLPERVDVGLYEGRWWARRVGGRGEWLGNGAPVAAEWAPAGEGAELVLTSSLGLATVRIGAPSGRGAG